MSAELDVRNTAKLARLELSEAETSRFQTQLSQVLSYVEKLKEVDVTGVEPTAHTSEVQNVFRADELLERTGGLTGLRVDGVDAGNREHVTNSNRSRSRAAIKADGRLALR